MKKKYVAPVSKLITLNLDESIAISGGVDEVGGMSVIRFYANVDGCRQLYTERLPVSEGLQSGGDFMDYYNEFLNLVSQNAAFEAYFYCFGQSQNV